MKKTYNQPACLVVELGTNKSMMQASLPIDKNNSNTITDGSQILVKENNSSDVNLWDNEW